MGNTDAEMAHDFSAEFGGEAGGLTRHVLDNSNKSMTVMVRFTETDKQIELGNNGNRIFIGRSKELGIFDRAVSRRQGGFFLLHDEKTMLLFSSLTFVYFFLMMVLRLYCHS